MYVEMHDETGQVSKDMQEDIVKLLGTAAQKLNLSSEKEMMITFVDNEKIQEINLYYRDKDAPTDVVSLEYKPEEISFDEDIDFEGFDASELMNEFDSYIGELYISVDKAHEQAEEYGHSFEREMGFLAVHGFLHINGYDHYTPEEEKEMFELQEEILTAYGLKR